MLFEQRRPETKLGLRFVGALAPRPSLGGVAKLKEQAEIRRYASCYVTTSQLKSELDVTFLISLPWSHIGA